MAVQWLNDPDNYRDFMVADSFRLRNRQLLAATKRYVPFLKSIRFTFEQKLEEEIAVNFIFAMSIMHLRKYLNLGYGLFGLFVAYSFSLRLWEEGTFGNEIHILFLIMIGPYIGISGLFSGIILAAGQTLEFLDKYPAIWFSRISFLLAVLILFIEYFIYGGIFIWSELFDFFVFSLLTSIFYLPIIVRWNYLHRDTNT